MTTEEKRMPERVLVARYQACTMRLWEMFPRDPLPFDCVAQAWIERLEALLDHGLLQPVPPPGKAIKDGQLVDDDLHTRIEALEHDVGVLKLRTKRLAQKPLKLCGVPCPQCKGVGHAYDTRERCPQCNGRGEIA